MYKFLNLDVDAILCCFHLIRWFPATWQKKPMQQRWHYAVVQPDTRCKNMRYQTQCVSRSMKMTFSWCSACSHCKDFLSCWKFIVTKTRQAPSMRCVWGTARHAHLNDWVMLPLRRAVLKKANHLPVVLVLIGLWSVVLFLIIIQHQKVTASTWSLWYFRERLSGFWKQPPRPVFELLLYVLN